MADNQDQIDLVNEQIKELKKLKLKDLQVPTFSGNQKEWRQFKISLFSSIADYDIQDVLDGEESFPFPEDDENATPLELVRIRYFVLRDRVAKRLLMQSTKGDALDMVTAGAIDETASSSWKRLAKRYEGDRRTKIEILQEKLFEPRLLRKPDEMPQHLQQFIDIASQLRDLDEPVSFVQMRGLIDRSLPPTTYEATLREAKRGEFGEDQDPNTLHNLCEALRNDALKVKAKMSRQKRVEGSKDLTDDRVIALLARHMQTMKQDSRKGRPAPKDGQPQICEHCGKKGHTIKNCWSKDPSTRLSKDGKPPSKPNGRKSRRSRRADAKRP